MKNPNPMMNRDGVSDAGLIRAARDMYEALELLTEGGLSVSNRLDGVRLAVAALSKARGQS